MNTKTSTLMSLGISIALIAAGIWFLWNHQNSFGHGDSGWAMPYHMMMVGSGMGIVMVLLTRQIKRTPYFFQMHRKYSI